MHKPLGRIRTWIHKNSVVDPNPNPMGSERFEGSESDQTVWIRILIY
jgi:hypothetical protein